MTAPTVALTAAPLRPTKSCGRAAGRRTLKKVVIGPAPVERQKRCRSTANDVNAKIEFSNMGKKQTKKTIKIFGAKPKPNQVTKTGANTILGIISTVTASGYSVRRRNGEKAMSRAS